jgi:hypothetical protein
MGRTATAVRRQDRAAAMVIALAAVLAAACGPASLAPNGAPSRSLVAARPVVPPGGSPSEARAVGRRMLASLILPAGSHRIAPRSLPPRSELIGGENVVDVSRFYWLPLPEDAASSFLQHHVPAGTAVSGTGSGDSFVEVQYSLKAPLAGLETFNMLLATLTPGPGGGTLMRADAELTWYPARSTAEYIPPAGYRSVTLSATFFDRFGHREPRITRVFTSQAVIARLARLLDAMHATAPRTGSCPALLPQFRIMFAPKRSGNSPAAPVLVTPAGCSGELITTGGTSQPALEDFGSTRLLRVIGPLLGVHRCDW